MEQWRFTESPSVMTEIRENAAIQTKCSATKMSLQYSQRKRIKVEEFKIGDNVSVNVPKNERTATDLPRVPGKVIKVCEKAGLYEVGTKFGLLKSKLRAGDLQRYTDNVDCDSSRVVSLQECCRLTNAHNKFVKKSCKCKSGCKSKNCSCVSNGIDCSTHCHPGEVCQNTPKPLACDVDLVINDQWPTDREMALAALILSNGSPDMGGLQQPNSRL